MQRSVITVSWIMSVSGGCVERRQLTNEIENIKIDTAVTADSRYRLTFNTNYLLLWQQQQTPG